MRRGGAGAEFGFGAGSLHEEFMDVSGGGHSYGEALAMAMARSQKHSSSSRRKTET